MTVYVPYGEGAALCETLLSGSAVREIYRRAGRYSLSLYSEHYRALLAAGDIAPLDEDSGVLTNSALYGEQTGLSLQADTGKAQFI